MKKNYSKPEATEMLLEPQCLLVGSPISGGGGNNSQQSKMDLWQYEEDDEEY